LQQFQHLNLSINPFELRFFVKTSIIRW